MPYYKAVFDERFEEARAFAAQATARATRFIGFTTPASLFCLHLLARDRGMRLRFCRTKLNKKAVLGVLDGALPSDRIKMRLPSSDLFELVLWIIAPSARASAKEIANA
jgi:hypothetical protein